MSEFEDVQKLIRLKRYEQPSDEYFDAFLDEFQSRQRSELLNGSARKLFFERVATYMSGFGKTRWVYGAGAAYAMATVLFFATRGANEQVPTSNAGATPVSSLFAPPVLEPGPSNFDTIALDPSKKPSYVPEQRELFRSTAPDVVEF